MGLAECVLVTAAVFILGARGNHDARRLYDDLLERKHYNKLVRPVENYSEPVKVGFGLKFAQLNDVVSHQVVCTLLMNSFVVHAG
jgi:nicotinic acetylcholine receptor